MKDIIAYMNYRICKSLLNSVNPTIASGLSVLFLSIFFCFNLITLYLFLVKLKIIPDFLNSFYFQLVFACFAIFNYVFIASRTDMNKFEREYTLWTNNKRMKRRVIFITYILLTFILYFLVASYR
jgi:hypothetical protein